MGHIVPELPTVSLGSPDRTGAVVDLADVMEPLQSYLLTCSADQNVFVSTDSISSCAEMLAEFGDKALQPSNDPWASVDFHGRAKIHADLAKTYMDVRIAANVETDADVTLSSGSPEKLLPQRKRPVQRPRIDLSKTSKAVAGKLVFRNCVLLVLARVVIARDLYYFECWNFVNLDNVIDDWYIYVKIPSKKVCEKMKNMKEKNERDAQKGAELKFCTRQYLYISE